MDYEKFYSEIAKWIQEVNNLAMKYGIKSNEFWNWVMKSAGEMCDYYGNNELVKMQMAMLINWLEDAYEAAT